MEIAFEAVSKSAPSWSVRESLAEIILVLSLASIATLSFAAGITGVDETVFETSAAQTQAIDEN